MRIEGIRTKHFPNMSLERYRLTDSKEKEEEHKRQNENTERERERERKIKRNYWFSD
jgi:hypothetical protein